jgi:hypothetical protein
MGKTKELTEAALHRRFDMKQLAFMEKDECGCGFVFIPLTSFLDSNL